MLLWPELDSPEVLKQFPADPAKEDLIYLPGAVVWRIDRTKMSTSRMLKIIGTKLYKQLTVRNPNTIRKVYALMQA